MGARSAMVVVELMGGLGNQLFQYAAGRALSSRLGCALSLDLRLLEVDVKREYALDVYQLAGLAARPSVAGRLLQRLTTPFRRRTVALPRFEENREKGAYDEAFEAISSPVVLHGYYQSEKYFESIKNEIRRDLQLRHALSTEAAKAQERILACGQNAVSVHLRRGDYVSEAHTRDLHGVLGVEFYRIALAQLMRHVPEPHAFVFTDEPQAVAEIRDINVPMTVVSGTGLADFEELHLMSVCHHHITANSSFSWWGAWLGDPAGLTVVPKRWFSNESEIAVRQRFSKNWIVL